MSTQSLPLLPDLVPTGADYKSAGIAQVLRYTPPDYRTRFELEVRRRAGTGELFTAEDIVQTVGYPPPPAHYNCIGAIIHVLARKGVIRRTDFRRAGRTSRRSAVVAVWVGGEKAR